MAALNLLSEEPFIHFSQIATALACERKHEYSYVQRLEPRGYNPRMLFGTFGHAALADLWLGGDKFKEEAFAKAINGLSGEQILEVETMLSEAKAVAKRAFQEMHTRFTPFLLNGIPLVEHSLKAKVGEVSFGGTPDLVAVERDTGNVWVIDYKFRKTFVPPESENLNLQMLTYQKLLSMYGVETVGTRQFQIRPFLPKTPKTTVKGKMSRADVFTTWEAYAAACLANGENPAEYEEEMRPKLAGHVFWDFDSCSAYRTPEEVTRVWNEDIVPTIERVANQTIGKRRCFTAKVCEMCSYSELCIEDLKGGDTEFLAKVKYRNKDESDVVIGLIDEEEIE